MKKLFFCLLVIPVFAKAQKLMVEGSGSNLYLLHKVTPKENFYSIGRMYNVSPKEIAPYNKLVLDKGVSIGQEIKIPLKNNFSVSSNTPADETAVPVYHTAEPKENLTLISSKYGKASLASLKEWNHLKSDAVPAGATLIIGFLNVKSDVSSLAKGNAAISTKTQEPAETVAAPVKQETKTPVPAKEPVAVPVKEVAIAPVKETAPATKKEPVVNTPAATNNVESKGSAFKNGYNNSGKEEKGTAGVFKSTSGWEDGKYYCLHNTALPNTIVKITNNTTGKFIYAKVLDLMPDLKQNAGLIIQISNAGSEALGGDQSNFDCTINY